MKYWIETYGCQMNIAESNAIELELLQHGLEKAEKIEDSDCIIINTCSVRKTAEDRVWGRLTLFDHIKRGKEDFTIIVTGCMAERLKQDLKDDAPFVDYVLGTNDKVKIANILSNKVVETESKDFSFNFSYYKEGDTKSFIPILNGCNNFCAFCIVPYVRGREVSRSLSSILEEIDFLESKGVKEITLLGQNVNSYNYQGLDFPSLLKEILKRLNVIEKIRFESPHPKDFSDDLIQLIANEEKISKTVHLPLQSGSDRILKLMNRKYDFEKYYQIVQKLLKLNPDIKFVADLMVGFPSESEEDFALTLEAVNKIKFVESFMYYYNPREGTRATKMPDQIDKDVKLDRLARLIKLQRKIGLDFRKDQIGKIKKVLVEGVSKRDKNQYYGRSDEDMVIVFTPKEEIKTKYINLVVTGVKGNTMIGEQVL